MTKSEISRAINIAFKGSWLKIYLFRLGHEEGPRDGGTVLLVAATSRKLAMRYVKKAMIDDPRICIFGRQTRITCECLGLAGPKVSPGLIESALPPESFWDFLQETSPTSG